MQSQRDTKTPAAAGVLAVRAAALGVGRDFLVLNSRRLPVGLANVDAALEERAVLDADARCGNIAGQSAFRTDVNAIGGCDVALQLAEYHDLARADARIDHAVFADRHTIPGDIDAALDLSIDEQ